MAAPLITGRTPRLAYGEMWAWNLSKVSFHRTSDAIAYPPPSVHRRPLLHFLRWDEIRGVEWSVYKRMGRKGSFEQQSCPRRLPNSVPMDSGTDSDEQQAPVSIPGCLKPKTYSRLIWAANAKVHTLHNQCSQKRYKTKTKPITVVQIFHAMVASYIYNFTNPEGIKPQPSGYPLTSSSENVAAPKETVSVLIHPCFVATNPEIQLAEFKNLILALTFLPKLAGAYWRERYASMAYKMNVIYANMILTITSASLFLEREHMSACQALKRLCIVSFVM